MASVAKPPSARFSICLLEDDDGRLLFIKRAPHLRFGAELWGFPSGHIEIDESPSECAAREMNEEIGEQRKLSFVKSLGPLRDTFYGGKYEVHLFHFRWHSGVVELNEEHTDYRWLGASEFAQIDAMLGVEEDIVLLDIWPRSTFDPARLPPS